LKQASLANFPTTITFAYNGRQYTTRLSDLFALTDTQAFIVIRDNTVIYEKYLNGAHRDTLFTSFSMAKSVTSALIGIAIDEGKIKSVNDPVISYVPELKGRGFDSLTIRDMLLMYNDFYPLLEGLILQRVTGETVAQYTQDKLWQPMGMEYPASWSLDSSADGSKKQTPPSTRAPSTLPALASCS
jgi:CubicO group peptidase (beta-lactamase class C family)